MKSATTTILFCMIFIAAFPQSKSFYTLGEKFAGSSNVFSFSTSGFLARTVLRMAGEHEFNDAIREVKNIRLMVIPKEAFSRQKVTLTGFRKIAKEDAFEELINVRDNGDEVTILLQRNPKNNNRNNRYLLLVDSNTEVVVIEVKGYIDPAIMRDKQNKLPCNYN